MRHFKLYLMTLLTLFAGAIILGCSNTEEGVKEDTSALKKAVQQKIDQLDDKVNEMQDKVAEARDDASEELKEQMDDLSEMRDNLVRKANNLEDATQAELEELQTSVDNALEKLQNSVSMKTLQQADSLAKESISMNR